MPRVTVTLVACPDEFLLELERGDLVDGWVADHPDGEVRKLSPAPSASELVRELVSRSLFCAARLLVVPDATPYFSGKAGGSEDRQALARQLGGLSFEDVGLLLTAASEKEPEGDLVDVIRDKGEVRYMPLPPAPKPWEDVRLSEAQRKVLRRVLERTAPGVLGHPEAVDALCDAYGFHARDLAQAAQRLVLSGEISAAAVRQQAGPGECSLDQLEEALRDREAATAARLLGVLHSGGALVGWRGEAVDSDRVGAVVAGHLARLLRQALALRAHATRCGLTSELDSQRCASPGWYPRAFKPRVFPKLEAEIAATSDSPLGGRSAWALHHTFRLAAAYREDELLLGLAWLGSSGAERLPARPALTAVTHVFLGLACGELTSV